jgi:hypothetical protein
MKQMNALKQKYIERASKCLWLSERLVEIMERAA